MSRTAYRTCPLCEALCGLELTVEGHRVTRVRGDAKDPFSKGFICPKGATLGVLDGDPDRLQEPLVRSGDEHAKADWEHSFAVVQRRLREIITAHGANAVAIYLGNPSAHTIAGPLYGAAVVKAIGTRNLYTASTSDQMPKHVSSGRMFGDPMAVPVPDLDRTDHLLMLGANPLESNGSLCSAPDFPGRLKAIRRRGGTITVVDPRRTRTAALADRHVFIRPGADAYLLLALVHTLFAEDLVRLRHLAPAGPAASAGPSAPSPAVNGLDDLRALAVGFSPETVAETTGIQAAEIRRMARELAAADRAAVYGRLGTCTQEFGTLASWLVDVLNVLTGNLDREGGAMFPRAAHVPVYRKKRPFTSGRWQSRVRGLPEMNGELPAATLADEILTPGVGQVRALITIGGNPVLSTANGARLDEALAGLDFMVSVDPYLNETTRHADVILPPPRPAQTGHFDLALTGFAVRNYVRYSPPAIPPPDGRPTESDILARLATIASGQDADPALLDEFIIGSTLAKATAAEGSPVQGRDPAELRDLLRGDSGAERRLDMMLRLGPYGDGFGAEPDGLTLTGLRDDHPHGLDLGALTPRLGEVLCTASGRVELCPPPFAADVERLRAGLRTGPATEAEPYVLIGRRHLRSNNSWLHNVPELVGGSNRCTLQLNHDDAARLGVGAGDLVRVISRTGAVEAVAEPTESLMAGVVSLPHGWGHDRPGTRMRTADGHAGQNVNAITDEREIDPLSGNSVFNGVPVRLEPLGHQIPV
ncbi:molybdopterin-dependent oxidoreductase [Actinomadura sp. HBU206391]|uniref:molybdopterin-dependent oxidoreductase n=1 Tax=Actinomadura sp. HBU206391 TaxID=2731692 RepID=UPI001650980F|nr:molybdopterin-dependent oxidoreductase [Actinomadura sp. HBU206391]MBC6459579.1 molybdopterin-dependent oxidoreductase [Actinomadura sp. HBU206391]